MENKCIVILKNSDKDFAPCLTVQEIMEFCIDNNIQFVACHIEDYEYEKMAHEINMINCVYEEHYNCSDQTYNHFRYICAYDMKNQTVKFASFDEKGKELSYELDLNKDYVIPSSNIPFYKEFDSGKYGVELKIYTTETVENIVRYYNKNSIVNTLLDNMKEYTYTNKGRQKTQDILNLRQRVNQSYNNK